MKTVILAAGKGSRLGERQLPKPLTLLANGKSILAQQLENISSCSSLHDVIIVVGYRKELIMDQFPEATFIYNPFFSIENTSKSLLRALQKIEEDVLWMNGDVVFHPSILSRLLEFKTSCMLVNEGTVGEEEVKYRANGEGKILEVSKQVKEANGEALGINFFKKKDLNLLKEELMQCSTADYFEKGIEEGIKKGIDVYSYKIGHHECTEIDFPEDLVRANEMITHWHLS
jgi:L-glutamine-phosphate cytidylyltransferase